MNKLNEKELKETCGGGFLTKSVVYGILAGAAFLIGVIDGYFRPLACNK